jgi:hypothetical protein
MSSPYAKRQVVESPCVLVEWIPSLIVVLYESEHRVGQVLVEQDLAIAANGVIAAPEDVVEPDDVPIPRRRPIEIAYSKRHTWWTTERSYPGLPSRT